MSEDSSNISKKIKERNVNFSDATNKKSEILLKSSNFFFNIDLPEYREIQSDKNKKMAPNNESEKGTNTNVCECDEPLNTKSIVVILKTICVVTMIFFLYLILRRVISMLGGAHIISDLICISILFFIFDIFVFILSLIFFFK
jgi:hypothetical protein